MARRKTYELHCKNPDCVKTFMGEHGQLYCSKECCNDVTNKRNRQDPNGITKIDRILHLSHKVLKNAYDPTNPNKLFSGNFLQLSGLNTKYYTNLETMEDGKLIYWVYNYGFIGQEDGIKIIKK